MKPPEISNSKNTLPSLGRREMEKKEVKLAWRDQLLEGRTSSGPIQCEQGSQWEAVLETLSKAEKTDSGFSLCLLFYLLSLHPTEQAQ